MDVLLVMKNIRITNYLATQKFREITLNVSIMSNSAGVNTFKRRGTVDTQTQIAEPVP